MTVGWQEKVWDRERSRKHIRELEKELAESECPMLRVHISRLKRAWGIRRKNSPSSVAA